jgi:hypothetical protein
MINSMTALFNVLSSHTDSSYVVNTGNAIMTSGGSAMVNTGLYKCSEGTCAANDKLVVLSGLSGLVKCHSDDASCILDGEGTHIVFAIFGTEGLLLTVRALHITRGKWNNCGGLGVNGNSLVDVVLCVFTFNEPLINGAGALGVMSGEGENGQKAIQFSEL